MIGNIELEFKHTTKRMINSNSYNIGLVIQALDVLKEDLTNDQINTIKNYLSEEEIRSLKKESNTKENKILKK